MKRNASISTIQSSTPKPQTAKEVIAANVKALIEQLEAGHGDALTAYLNAMSRFHNYSFGNILEIARQKPDAIHVAGLYTWNQLGRRVKKGEKGIRILAPIIGVRGKKDEEAEKDLTRQNVPILVGFRAAYVFDVSQTEGKELPEHARVSGDAGANRDRLIESQQIAIKMTGRVQVMRTHRNLRDTDKSRPLRLLRRRCCSAKGSEECTHDKFAHLLNIISPRGRPCHCQRRYTE